MFLFQRVFFFFFQAEDGIRDYKVTGVQTCALPIWPTSSDRCPTAFARASTISRARCSKIASVQLRSSMGSAFPGGLPVRLYLTAARSEERRVGEGSRRTWPQPPHSPRGRSAGTSAE